MQTQAHLEVPQAFDASVVSAVSQEAFHAFWTRQFPEHGAELVRQLELFYFWSPRLSTPTSSLDECAVYAVYWHPVQQAQEYSVRRALFGAVFQATFGDSIGYSLWDSIGCKIEDADRERLHRTLEESFAVLKPAFDASLTPSWWRLKIGFPEDAIPRYLASNPLRMIVWHAFIDTLFHLCAFILAGETKHVQRLNSFLQLWIAGYYPIGIDRHDRLLLLTA